MVEKREVKIYPWTLSATGLWGEETGLFRLRDENPAHLVPSLWVCGTKAQNSAILELTCHGNPRKAAEVARALVEQHSVCERSIRAAFPNIADDLLERPLDSLPSCPEEYPPDIKITYIQ